MWSNLIDQSADSGLYAVLLGASIALVGSFVGTVYTDYRHRSRLETEAKALTAHLLMTLFEMGTELQNADYKYEPVWVRLLRRFHREQAVFERNREGTINIRDVDLRSDIVELSVRIGLTADGLLEDADRIAALEEALEQAPPEKHAAIQAKLDQQWIYRRGRDAFFQSAMDEIPSMLMRLEGTSGKAQPKMTIPPPAR
jgi:hypothetical protein